MKANLEILQKITNYILDTEIESFMEYIEQGNDPRQHIYGLARLVWGEEGILQGEVEEILEAQEKAWDCSFFS